MNDFVHRFDRVSGDRFIDNEKNIPRMLLNNFVENDLVVVDAYNLGSKEKLGLERFNANLLRF